MAKTKKAKETENKSTAKEIVIKETEDDVVFGNGYGGDPEQFKEEIKKEAEKNALASRFLLPAFVFVTCGMLFGAATWYYAKPENNNQPAEQKIQTPPAPGDESEKNPTPTPIPTPAPTPQPQVQTYSVQEGDTMSGIANKYGLTSQELAAYNGITDVNSLRIGQVLKIPAK